MMGLFKRVLRRCFRMSIRLAVWWRVPDRIVGRSILPGYGLIMRYPDRKIWVYQLLEIFVEDCYGVYKLPKNPLVFDCGANIGTFALFVKWSRPAGRVVCVEPSINNREYLEENVFSFQGHGVEVISKALGSNVGVAKIGGATSDTMRIDKNIGEDVDVVPLSDLINEPVDLVKIDVEGFERYVVEGIGDKIHFVKRIVVECHAYCDRKSDLVNIIDLLDDKKFDRFVVHSLRDFEPDQSVALVHCCLLEAWKSREVGQND